MRTIFSYFGGKHYLKNHILKLFPKHNTYCEVFGGSGVILLNKTKSNIEVYNDIDNKIVNLFRVVRDKDKFEEFTKLVSLTPYSRLEFNDAKQLVYETTNDVQLAYYTYLLFNMSFNGGGKTFSYSVESGSIVDKYISRIPNLSKIHNRLKPAIIEHLDFKDLINRYDSEDTLFYLDPPYVHSERSENKSYNYECTDDDHLDLLSMLFSIKGKFILSGYDNPIYDCLNIFNKININVPVWSSSIVSGKEKRYTVESLWYNFDKLDAQLSLW